MPIYRTDQAVDTGGFAQVREALNRFEGDVTEIVDGTYPAKLDDEGNPMAPKEFVDIFTVNNKVLDASEQLTMDITQKYNFRVNCSNSKTSFWVKNFLASADKNKVLMPDGLKGKRVVFKKETAVAKDPKFNYTNMVIESILGPSSPAVQAMINSVPAPSPAPVPGPVAPTPSLATSATEDPMEIAMNLAIGKTEAQFRSAISMHPSFVNSPFLSLAKTGAITQSLVNDGKLVLVTVGNKQIYNKVE